MAQNKKGNAQTILWLIVFGLIAYLFSKLYKTTTTTAVSAQVLPVDARTGAPGYNSMLADTIPPGQPLDPIDLATGQVTSNAQQPSCPQKYQVWWDIATNTYHCFPT